MKFQRKLKISTMSQKSASPNLLAKEEAVENQEKKFVCQLCDHKGFKYEGALKNHMKKIHGSNEDSLIENGFDPVHTSTVENFMETQKVGDDPTNKRKREDRDIDGDEDEDVSNKVEEAKKAREARSAIVAQIAVERDLGFGI